LRSRLAIDFGAQAASFSFAGGAEDSCEIIHISLGLEVLDCSAGALQRKK